MTNLMTALEEMQTQTLTIQASGIHATAAKWLLLEASTDFAAKAELPGRGDLWERTQAARKQAEWHAEGQGVTLRDLLRSHGLLATADRLAPSPETDLTGLRSAQDVHNKLQSDRAYTWSRENNDYHNMMIVLRAHGFNHTVGHAKHMVDFVPSAPDHRAWVSDEMAMIASSDARISNENYCQTIQAALSLYDAALLRGDGCDEGTKWTEITPDDVATVFLSRVMGVPPVA